MSNPEFCCVIPTYNSSDTIIRAIESVMNQTYPVKEIIVVDDCSNDYVELSALLDSYSNIVRLIRHDKNMYGGAARNTGIRNATTSWIAFLDSDDMWIETKIEDIVSAMRDNYDLYNVYYSQLYKGRIDGKYSILPRRGMTPSEHISEYLFFFGGLMQTSTLVCSKKLLGEIYFNPLLKRHQDYDLCLRMYDRVNFIFIKKPLSFWIQSGKDVLRKGASSDFSRQWLDDYEKYFTNKGYIGFKVNVLAPLYIKELRFHPVFYIFKKAFKQREYVILSRSLFKIFKSLIKGVLLKWKKN